VIAAEDFFISHFTTALEEDELLTEVEFPRPTHRRARIEEMTRRHGDFAIVGVATTLRAVGGRIEAARVVLTAFLPPPSAPARRRLCCSAPSLRRRCSPRRPPPWLARSTRRRSAWDVGLPSLRRRHLDPTEPGALAQRIGAWS